MVRHIWSVLCSQSIIDRDTNNISLQQVIEQITVGVGGQPPPGTTAILPISLEVVSFWEREDQGEPARGRGRLILLQPSGEPAPEAMNEFDIDLTSYQRYRTRAKIQGLPIREPGRHEFQVQSQLGDDASWETVARIPLQILLEIAEPAP